MVALRLIPCLDVADGRVVKGVNFVGLRDAGDPVELACRYSQAGADELVFLDIAASHQGRATLVDMVRRTAEEVTIPFTVGGGISSVEGITELLRAGADKVSLNSSAVRDPELVARGAERFGCQCIVVAIDARRRKAGEPGWDVFVKGGRENTGLDVVTWASRVAELGAGEILLTSMDGDGTQAGYDLELTRAVAQAVPVPVIASGGAGCLDHIAAALDHGPGSRPRRRCWRPAAHGIDANRRGIAERGIRSPRGSTMSLFYFSHLSPQWPPTALDNLAYHWPQHFAVVIGFGRSLMNPRSSKEFSPMLAGRLVWSAAVAHLVMVMIPSG